MIVARYDIYEKLHAGLRRALLRLLAEGGDWPALRTRLIAQLHDEDTFLGPHLACVAPALFARVERDHRALEVSMRAVQEADLARFIADYLVQLSAEEHACSLALQRAYTDRDLMAIEAAGTTRAVCSD